MEHFDTGFARIAGRFSRVEPRRRARSYLLALLADVETRSCWQLAEHAGEASPHGMQRLLGEAVWDADAVRDDLRGYVAEQLGDPEAVLVIDLCRTWNYADLAPAGGSAVLAVVGSARW